MKQLHRPRLIMTAGGFQTESVKKQGVMYSPHARHVGSQVNQRGLL